MKRLVAVMEKRYKSGLRKRKVTIEPWGGPQYRLSVEGSELETLHVNEAVARVEAEIRIKALELAGWRRRADAQRRG